MGEDCMSIALRSAADVLPQSPRFAWDQRVPMGTVSLLAGREGLGKSTVAVKLAARITRGVLPGDLYGEPAHVVLASAEDSPQHTLVPRLMSAGADLGRVSFVEAFLCEEEEIPGTLSLPDDLHELEAECREVGARLLVVDPIVSYLPTKINAHRDQHVRSSAAERRGAVCA